VLAPLYWRRVRIRDGILAGLAIGLLYIPFLNGGAIPMGSLGVFVQRFRFNDPAFAFVERALRPQVAAGFAVVSGLLIAAWIRSKRPAPSLDAWGWPMAVSLASAPVVYPWYLLWLVPFLGSPATLPLMIWTLTVLPVFFVWYSHALGGPWEVPGRILVLEFGPIALAVLVLWIRRRRFAAGSRLRTKGLAGFE
jgi:hypothetical protein